MASFKFSSTTTRYDITLSDPNAQWTPELQFRAWYRYAGSEIIQNTTINQNATLHSLFHQQFNTNVSGTLLRHRIHEERGRKCIFDKSSKRLEHPSVVRARRSANKRHTSFLAQVSHHSTIGQTACGSQAQALLSNQLSREAGNVLGATKLQQRMLRKIFPKKVRVYNDVKAMALSSGLFLLLCILPLLSAFLIPFFILVCH